MPDAPLHNPIISFTKNPLENSNLLGELFTVISQKQVIEIHYHTFAAPQDDRHIIFHPYLLKEYNRRWFVIGAADSDGKILNFSLDRINKIVPLTARDYIEPSEGLLERFEDIIGVTYLDDSPIYQIIFWANDKEKDYIKTKPIHESQRNLTGEREEQLRKENPALSGGSFFRIDCKYNYELIRALTSYGGGVIVLAPSEIREEIIKRVKDMALSYNC